LTQKILGRITCKELKFLREEVCIVKFYMKKKVILPFIIAVFIFCGTSMSVGSIVSSSDHVISRYPPRAYIEEGIIMPLVPPDTTSVESVTIQPDGRVISRDVLLFVYDSMNWKGFKAILLADGSKVYRKEYPHFVIEVYPNMNARDFVQFSIMLLEPNNEPLGIKNVNSLVPFEENVIDGVKEVLESLFFSTETCQHLLTAFSTCRQDKNDITRQIFTIEPMRRLDLSLVQNYTIGRSFIEHHIIDGVKVRYEGNPPPKETFSRGRGQEFFVFNGSYENIGNGTIVVNWDQVIQVR
jgi:hypothetical protein